MINIVTQTIDFYFNKLREPKTQELEIKNTSLLNTRWSCFVTIFLNWEVRWAAGNIKEIKDSLAEEIIANTIEAITNDKRFSKLTKAEAKNIKIRVDIITKRKVLARVDEEAKKQVETISKIDPIKNWIIVIKKDYSKASVILPNIDPKIIKWTDYKAIISAKLNESFDEDKYIIYELETKQENNY